MKSRKILLIVFIVVVIIVGVQHVFLDEYPSSGPVFALNIPEARRLATARGDRLPTKIQSVIVAEGAFPANGVVAGETLFRKRSIVFTSSRVVYPDGFVIIDTAHDQAIQDEFFSGNPFYQDKFEIVQNALEKAKLILITHEHMDHVGGISHAVHFDKIAPRVAMTKEQLEGDLSDAKFPKGTTEQLKPLVYDQMISPEPGIVLIKAPGHSTGSQIIFVRLKDGKEFLFIGDIAWDMDNVTWVRGRPRIVSMLLKEDRLAVRGQLEAIKKAAEKEKLIVVAAHDKDQWEDYVKKGWVEAGY